MFSNAFQSGVAVEVLSVSDKNPPWVVTKNKWKAYDKTVKGYCILLDTHTAKLAFPNNERQSLALVQRFLVIQCYLYPTQNFTLEVALSDAARTKRRVLFTGSAKELVASPLHARVPNSSFTSGVWVNLSIDLLSFMVTCFPGSTFRSLESFTIHSYCKLRRVFTMRNPLFDTTERNAANDNAEAVPRSCEFPAGVQYLNQVIAAEMVSGPVMLAKHKASERKHKKVAFGSKVPASTAPARGKSTASPQKKTGAVCLKLPVLESASSTRYNQWVGEEKIVEEETIAPRIKSKPPLAESPVAASSLRLQEEIKESIHVYSSVEQPYEKFEYQHIPDSPTESIEEDIEYPLHLEHNYFPTRDSPELRQPQPTFYSTFVNEATEPRPFTPPFSGLRAMREVLLSKDSLQDEEEVELVYDPVLKCYYDPNTHEYYEIKD